MGYDLYNLISLGKYSFLVFLLTNRNVLGLLTAVIGNLVHCFCIACPEGSYRQEFKFMLRNNERSYSWLMVGLCRYSGTRFISFWALSCFEIYILVFLLIFREIFWLLCYNRHQFCGGCLAPTCMEPFNLYPNGIDIFIKFPFLFSPYNVYGFDMSKLIR